MRSLLFVPADSQHKIDKAMLSEADALILDLEDSVATTRKPAAREIAVDALNRLRPLPHRPRLIVRVNPLNGAYIDADLDAIVPAQPDVIMLPKAAGGNDIMLLSAKIAAREALADTPNGEIKIIAIATEMAASLFTVGSYRKASQRLEGLTWGAEDLSVDIGAETNRLSDGSFSDPYRLARAVTLLGAASAGVHAIDTIFSEFRDLEGLRREAEAARRDGFTAKTAIHPAQIFIINEVFTPNPEAIAKAEAIVAAFAGADDIGVVGINGVMYDRPHLLRAKRLLARVHGAAETSP